MGDPYQISTCTHLQNMSSNLSSYFILTGDVDCSGLSGSGFTPVGTSGTPFSGQLDGQGYSINEFFIDRNSTTGVGLFGYIANGVVKNLRMQDANVTGEWKVGLLVGEFNSGTIENCHVQGAVAGSYEVAGLVGYLVNISSGSGALIDRSSANVTQTEVFVSNYAGHGFLVGMCYGDDTLVPVIRNSVGIGNFVAAAGYGTGGLVGVFRNSFSAGRCSLQNTFTTGTISGTSSQAGGLVGSMQGSDSTVSNSFSTVAVTASSGVRGAAIGNKSGGTLSGVYGVVASGGVNSGLDCVGSGSGTDCSTVTSASAFFDNSTQPPLDQWDFVNVWQRCPNTYPAIQGECENVLQSATIIPSETRLGTSGTLTVAFTTTNYLADDGIITVTLPSGMTFNSGGTSVAQSVSNIDGTLTPSVNGQTIKFTRSAGTDVAQDIAVSFVITNVGFSGTVGTSGSYSIAVKNSAEVTLDVVTVSGSNFDCAAGEFGVSCTACPGGSGSSACSGNGTCDDGVSGSGVCSCSTGFTDAACSACVSGRYGHACSICPGSGNCSGHGTCSDGVLGSGVCTCSAGYSGADCATEILQKPKLKGKKSKKNAQRVTFTCAVPEGNAPVSSYRFVIKGPLNGKKGPTKTLERATASYTKTFKKSGQYRVNCQYISAGAATSASSSSKKLEF